MFISPISSPNLSTIGPPVDKPETPQTNNKPEKDARNELGERRKAPLGDEDWRDPHLLPTASPLAAGSSRSVVKEERDTMKWSRSTACGHTEVRHYPRRPQNYLGPPVPPRPADWTEASSSPQDTYICCAYSPRCFIIQKVKPSSQTSEDNSDKKDEGPTTPPTTESQDKECEMSSQFTEPNSPGISGHVSNIHPGSFCNQTTAQLCRTDKTLNLDSCDRNSKVQVVFPDMDESTGIATSSPNDAASSNASSNPVPSETLTYQLSPNPIEIYPSNPEHMEEMATNERMDLPTLKALLRRQLEYYFSSENLSTDEYLQSQMDADRYVAISTVAKFNQVRRLTDDYNLVVEVLRESAVVQVDEAGEKVRPSPRSRVLILREIPESTPMKEIEELFSGETCPKFLRCEFAHNNSWYVLFETDEDTAKAYQYLREEAKTFRGKPVMARLKAKAVTSAPYTTYKNGASNIQEPDSYNGQQNVNQQQQQTPLQYTYTNVPSDSYNNQQALPPFYPPTMLQAWAPTTPACVDLGTVLSVNGLSPQAAFRPLNNNTNRHNYTSRERPVKAYTPQNYNFSRSEPSRYYNRGQSTSYLQRQQLHQQAASFPNIVNTNNCTFDYMPYTTSRSRNLHNFGVDMNFFTAPNLYYSKLPLQYPTHASQARHNPVLVPRSQVGLGAINCQDQSYLAVGNSPLGYAKDSGIGAVTGVKQSGDSQVKENWAPNQRQQRGKRWWKENGSSTSSRNYSESANSSFKSVNENEVKPESPKFDLETTSFPPLPGCMVDPDIDVDVYESRLSDIVKGTVRPTTRDTKTQTAESALVCSTKDSSTITVEDTVVPSDGAFTPPASPEVVVDTGSTGEPTSNVENCQEHSEWGDFVESPADSALCSSSINPINVVPEVPATFSASSTPAFHPASTNSVSNGSVVVAEASPAVLPEPEPIANVPSEVVIESRQSAAVKLPKAKQLDSLPKISRASCDLPSPKNKTPEASSTKNKFDSFKDRASAAPKHRTSFSNSKNNESSSSNKERVNDFVPANSKTLEHGSSKSSDVFHGKEKVIQGYGKSKMLESNKSKALEVESTLLSVNGHADSESTVSSEDEKQPFRKLTYSEVAIRAKDKVEKIAQELKEKERQEAMVRQHRQQDNVAQSGPFREFPRGRVVEPRPGSKEWRERRKPARAISLPATGQ